MLQINHKSSFKGEYRFFVLDEFGNIERGRGGVPVFRDQYGNLKKAGDYHSNLITDIGMTQIGYSNPTSDSFGVGTFRLYLKIATGADAPTFATTALSSYIGETLDNAGFSYNEYNEFGTNEITTIGDTTRVYENLSGGGLNIGSFALGSVSGNIAHIYELPRDSGGSPVVVSVPDGKKFRLDHRMRMSFPFETPLNLVIEERDFSGALIGTNTYNGNLYAVAQGNNFTHFFPHIGNDDIIVTGKDVTPVIGQSVNLFTTGILYDSDGVAPNSYSTVVDDSTTWERSRFIQMIESFGNEDDPSTGLIKGIYTGTTSGNTAVNGFYWKADSGVHIPKDQDHTLDLEYKISWSRG